jgi:hypothetical protein
MTCGALSSKECKVLGFKGVIRSLFRPSNKILRLSCKRGIVYFHFTAFKDSTISRNIISSFELNNVSRN